MVLVFILRACAIRHMKLMSFLIAIILSILYPLAVWLMIMSTATRESIDLTTFNYTFAVFKSFLGSIAIKQMEVEVSGE